MKAIRIKESVKGRHKKTSTNIKNQLASHIVERYPAFVSFIEKYYEWMEMQGSPLGDAYRLIDYLDIHQTRDDFLEFFFDELAPNFPKNVLVDKRQLLSHLTDFYTTKGTENSYKFLFKILYNESISFEYPSDFILKASDGIWSKETYLKIVKTNDSLIGRKVFGLVSGANAIVDRLVETDDDIQTLSIKRLNGSFIIGETIETRDTLSEVTTNNSGLIWKIDILDKGTGYVVGEEFALTNATFYKPARCIVSETDALGGIIRLDIIDSGSGYSQTFTDSNVNGKTAKLKCFVGTAFFDKGRYVSEQGKLNSICKLQNGKKFQEFSYVIKSKIPVSTYKDVIFSLVHPTGMFFSGELEVTDNVYAVNQHNSSIYYLLNIVTRYVSIQDIEKQYPNQPAQFYIDFLTDNFNVNVFITANDAEVTQDPILVPTFMTLEGGSTFITEDGDELEL